MSGWGALRSAVASGDLSGLGRLDIPRENAEAYVRGIPFDVLATQGLGYSHESPRTLAGVPWCHVDPADRREVLEGVCRSLFFRTLPMSLEDLRSLLRDRYTRDSAVGLQLWLLYNGVAHRSTCTHGEDLSDLLRNWGHFDHRLPRYKERLVLEALVVARLHQYLRHTDFDHFDRALSRPGIAFLQGTGIKEVWERMSSRLGAAWVRYLLEVEQ